MLAALPLFLLLPAVNADLAYGVVRLPSGKCELGSWLNPQACLLPLPLPAVLELGQWERTSRNLTASAEAQQAFQGERGGVFPVAVRAGTPVFCLSAYRASRLVPPRLLHAHLCPP